MFQKSYDTQVEGKNLALLVLRYYFDGYVSKLGLFSIEWIGEGAGG